MGVQKIVTILTREQSSLGQEAERRRVKRSSAGTQILSSPSIRSVSSSLHPNVSQRSRKQCRAPVLGRDRALGEFSLLHEPGTKERAATVFVVSSRRIPRPESRRMRRVEVKDGDEAKTGFACVGAPLFCTAKALSFVTAMLAVPQRFRITARFSFSRPTASQALAASTPTTA